MRKIHKAACILLCLITMVSALALPAMAQEAPDSTKPVSLKLNAVYDPTGEKVPLKDVTFEMYLVAEMGEDGSLPEFTDIVLDEPVDTCRTDGKGSAAFPTAGKKLKPGMYFISGVRTKQGGFVYETTPFFVSLPSYLDDRWEYALNADVKIERKPEKTNISVIKVWKDDCHPERRPKEIEVTLLCNGEKSNRADAKVKLNKENSWKYTWADLDNMCDWSVSEDRVEGYNNPEIAVNGNTVTVTNTCNRPRHQKSDKLPQTGQLWWPVPVLCAVGLALVVTGLVRRGKDDYED